MTGGDPLVVAVLGLGEAGSAIAAGASEQWLRQLADEQAGRAAPGG